MNSRDRLIELLEEAKIKAQDTIGSMNNGFGAWYADYLLANGVIAHLCNVGDTVYRVCKKKYDVNGYGMVLEEDWGIVTNSFELGMLHEIGKTVFLTREDAEKKLAERRKDNA